jgi:hypothetical protein
MIPEVDRYQGVVFRQILLATNAPVRIGVADLCGRVDTFSIEDAAFQIKHSSKRLSPWQFTYTAENLAELKSLNESFRPVWVFLVCGIDGVVGLSFEELTSMAELGECGAAWVRVKRSRHSMYRVSGAVSGLDRAKPRGVEQFLGEVFKETLRTSSE